ncbi:hypothetical protein BV455_02942 [Parageobacillus caldoxylosilyticus]|uniref:hypothetical protein n=1 Tax=Saccharococcus caldoxylosilyticus TaxID=81408 RepID=UPI001C4E266D|nr:hypothetical protein [Parageobacillus caldoxylosilyticus]QXJ39576.1 hypothetical protein BV455_02942 [Parageobacillus caldoxylosilyticus]
MRSYQVLLKGDRSVFLSNVYGVEIKGDHIKFLGQQNDIIAYFDRNVIEVFFCDGVEVFPYVSKE